MIGIIGEGNKSINSGRSQRSNWRVECIELLAEESWQIRNRLAEDGMLLETVEDKEDKGDNSIEILQKALTRLLSMQ